MPIQKKKRTKKAGSSKKYIVPQAPKKKRSYRSGHTRFTAPFRWDREIEMKQKKFFKEMEEASRKMNWNKLKQLEKKRREIEIMIEVNKRKTKKQRNKSKSISKKRRSSSRSRSTRSSEDRRFFVNELVEAGRQS
tara:strand:- start:80 stop:484 length:405 start_codon:yes stop_codon:yes gene_type:complete